MSEEKTTVENNGQQEAEDLKELLQIRRDKPVSYTHLDVYKRQVYGDFRPLVRGPGGG